MGTSDCDRNSVLNRPAETVGLARGYGGQSDLRVSIDIEDIHRAVSSIISAIGEDPQKEGLIETPRRIAEMYGDFFSGMGKDPKRSSEQSSRRGTKSSWC